MNSRTLSHREVWEAIPWILNGSLSEAETRAAQGHLGVCADCREALAFERRLREAMLQPQAKMLDAEAGWQRLEARIDAAAPLEQGGRAADVESMEVALANGAAEAVIQPRRLPPGPIRWLAAAVIVEALALGVIVSATWSTHAAREPAAAYRTLATVDPVTPAATIRVVLSPSLTLEQFGALLQNAHLQVVAGPSKAGVWSLAPAESTGRIATETALHELRDNPQVRFAEPLEQAGEPAVRPSAP